MAGHLGSFENRSFTAEEHHEWALKLWNRMDRDGSGSITREELNCDEFQDVLRSVVAPSNSAEFRSSYGRADMHIQQALDFCLRKATLNADGELTFKEFKSFMRTLRNQGDAHNRVHLMFALFDLDGSETIDKEEFVGIYSFFCGHKPTKKEVNLAFEQMDKYDKKEVTRKQFENWLKNDAPPAFRQHAAGVEADEKASSTHSRSSSKLQRSTPKVKKIQRPAPGFFVPRRTDAETWSTTWHSFWNNKFSGTDTALMNPTCPPRLKTYFSAPQTLPELERFYSQYRGFDKHRKELNKKDPPRKFPVLSTQSKEMEVNPERAAPGGTARNAKGDNILWDNEWPDKASDFLHKPKPGTLLLRCPGRPPPTLMLGRDAEHIAYRATVDRARREEAHTMSMGRDALQRALSGL